MLLALLSWSLLQSFSASGAPGQKRAEPKPVPEAKVRASAARLTAPSDLAGTETVQNGEGPLDGTTCAAGLKYSREGVRSGLSLLSTITFYLKMQGVDRAFDAVVRTGAAPGADLVATLHCEEVAFDLIRNMGTLRLPPFDEASWSVGDFGQDECGDTTAVILARRGKSSFYLTIPFVNLDPPGFTCLQPVKIQKGWCKKRTECVDRYLAVQTNQHILVQKMAALVEGFSFSR
jgi:hypothetical protein